MQYNGKKVILNLERKKVSLTGGFPEKNLKKTSQINIFGF